MHKLVILTGRLQGQKMTLPERDLFIGRDEDCQIRLSGTEVSRRHSKVRVTPDGVFVSDLGSRNGTFINDVAVEKESPLNPGDVLRVGTMLFQLEHVKPKPPSKQTPETGKEKDSVVPVREATEDSIANWLLTDEPRTGPHDTTIVGNRIDVETDVLPVASPANKKKHFATIKEEAEDIIRRHHEMLAAQKKK